LMASLMAFIWCRFLHTISGTRATDATVTGASARHYRTLAKRRSLRVAPIGVASTIGRRQPLRVAHPKPPVRVPTGSLAGSAFAPSSLEGK
jgi:hypothetical protein